MPNILALPYKTTKLILNNWRKKNQKWFVVYKINQNCAILLFHNWNTVAFLHFNNSNVYCFPISAFFKVITQYLKVFFKYLCYHILKFLFLSSADVNYRDVVDGKSEMKLLKIRGEWLEPWGRQYCRFLNLLYFPFTSTWKRRSVIILFMSVIKCCMVPVR